MRKIRSFLQGFFGSKLYNASITAVILLNCAVLGLETTAFGKGEYKNALKITDELCLAVFSIELALRIFAFKLAFSRARIGAGTPLTSFFKKSNPTCHFGRSD